MKDLIDLHTHTTASGHAYSTLQEMICAAAGKGLSVYGCSDHAPKMPGSTHSFYFINFKVIPRLQKGIHVLMGAELNILDRTGTIDLSPATLSRVDYTIASLHTPCFAPLDEDAHTEAYLNVMKNPMVTIIGHPDDSRYPMDHRAFARAAGEYGKLVEVNNSSLVPGSPRAGAAENYADLLSFCRKYEVPVLMGSDAHYEGDVGNHQYARRLLEELDYPEELIVNTSVKRLARYIPALARQLTEE